MTVENPPVYSLTDIFLLWYITAMYRTLSALAEPNRLRIVELLRDGPRPVGEITKRLALRQPQVSKHLRVLSEAGLVEVHPAAQQRIYGLSAKQFRELDSWVDTFHRIWDTRLDNLDDYLKELKAKQTEANTPRKKPHKKEHK